MSKVNKLISSISPISAASKKTPEAKSKKSRSFKPGLLKSLALIPVALTAPGLMNTAEAQDKSKEPKVKKEEKKAELKPIFETGKKIEKSSKGNLEALDKAKANKVKKAFEKLETKSSAKKADPKEVSALLAGMKAKNKQIAEYIKAGKLTKENAPIPIERLLLQNIKKNEDLGSLPKKLRKDLDANIKFTISGTGSQNIAAIQLQFLQNHFKYESKKLKELPEEQSLEIKEAWNEGKSKKEVRELMMAHASLFDSVNHTRKFYYLMIELLERTYAIQSGESPRPKDLKEVANLYKVTKLGKINLDKSNKAYIMAPSSRSIVIKILKSLEKDLKKLGVTLS